MSKILYLDTETSGVDPEKNAIIQIAGIIEVDGEWVDRFKLYIAPFDGAIIEDEALIVSGLTKDVIYKGGPEIAVVRRLESIWKRYVNRFDKNDKFTIAGFNVQFDVDFLKAMFLRCGHKFLFSYLSHRMIDPYPVARFLKETGIIDIPKCNLETVCSYFGVELTQAHDAMSDVNATLELIRKMTEKFKPLFEPKPLEIFKDFRCPRCDYFGHFELVPSKDHPSGRIWKPKRNCPSCGYDWRGGDSNGVRQDATES